MRCRKVISCLNAYVDGELPERQCSIVENHLATCEVCPGRLEEIRGIGELLQGTLPVPPVPDGLAARIMAEARRRQPTEIPGRRSPLPGWNPLQQWIAGLSAPMRLAAGATVLLALVMGWSLDGKWPAREGLNREPGRNLYGLEWFAPALPGSIGSVYIAMTDEDYRKGRR